MTQGTPAKPVSGAYKDTSVNIATAFATADFTRADLRPVPPRPGPSPPEGSTATAPNAPKVFQKVWATPKTPAGVISRYGPGKRPGPTPSQTKHSVTFAADTQFDDSFDHSQLAPPAAERDWQAVWRNTPNWVQRVQERKKQPAVPVGELVGGPLQSLAGPTAVPLDRAPGAHRGRDPLPPAQGRYNLRAHVTSPRRMQYNANFELESMEKVPYHRQPVEASGLKDSFLLTSGGSSADSPFFTQLAATSFEKSGLSPINPHDHYMATTPLGGPARGPANHRNMATMTPGLIDLADENIPNIMDMSPYLHSQSVLHTQNGAPLPDQPLWQEPQWMQPPQVEANLNSIHNPNLNAHPNPAEGIQNGYGLPNDIDNDSAAPTVVDGSDGEPEPTPTYPHPHIQPPPAVIPPGSSLRRRRGLGSVTDNMSYGHISHSNRFSEFRSDYPQIRLAHYGMGYFLTDTYLLCKYHAGFVWRTAAWPLYQLARLLYNLAALTLRLWLVPPLAWLIMVVCLVVNRLARVAGRTRPGPMPLLPAQHRLLAYGIFMFAILLGGHRPASQAWQSVNQWGPPSAPSNTGSWSDRWWPWGPGAEDVDSSMGQPFLPSVPTLAELPGSLKGALDDLLAVIQKRLLNVERHTRNLLTMEPRLQSSMDNLKQDLEAQRGALEEQAKQLGATQDRLERDVKQVREAQERIDQLTKGVTVDPEQISLEIQRALRTFQADILARPDYALFAAGGRVIPLLTSPTYEPGTDAQGRPISGWRSALAGLFGVGTSSLSNGPSVVLDADTTLGSCWPFRGTVGQLGVRLSRPVIPAAFTVEHVSPKVAIDISSALQQFEVWAIFDHRDLRETTTTASISADSSASPTTVAEHIINETDSNDLTDQSLPLTLLSPPPPVNSAAGTAGHERPSMLLGTYTYTPNADNPIQTYAIESTVLASLKDRVSQVRAVQLRVLSNHGHNQYTCLYRFRVHSE
ncbi:hypothetical protein H4R33_000918 [Dimargaris cristalligena]|nr:hypothetical protein H4R33_000918 [Dimargaris cristalligena]